MLPEIIKNLPTHMEICHNFICFHTKYTKTPSLPEQVVFTYVSSYNVLR